MNANSMARGRQGFCCGVRSMRFGVVVFQILFLVVQFFIFYPCLVNAPRENREQPVMPVDVVYQQQGHRIPGAQKLEDKATFKKFQYEPTWESLDSRPNPAWFDDVKIGIFLHWGVYSVPSFVDVGDRGLAEWFWWYWKASPEEVASHNSTSHINNQKNIQRYMQQHYPPGYQYTDFAPQFSAEFFEPEKWAEIFKASGAKYIVLTSKHHEGFTLWGSKRSWNWNAVDNGPHRDLVGDLAAAVKKIGLHFGVYHSLYEWFNPLYMEDKKNEFKTQTFVKDKLMPELTEVVTKYHPEVLWMDGDWEAPSSYWNATEFIAWLYNESPVKDTVVTNDRWGRESRCVHGGFLDCNDRYIPGSAGTKKWENCMTIDKESWGYRRNADLKDYFNMDELIATLAETVSKGGNLLMNVGPTADGKIAPIFQERLLQLGEWLRVNGEAIYGSRVWLHQNDSVTANVWYTTKTVGTVKSVYAIVLDFPKKATLDLGVPVPTQTTVVTWLGYGEKLSWKPGHQNNAGISISIPRILPHELPCQWAWVFKMENLAQ